MTKSTITREQITSWMNDANHTLEEPLNADDAAAARAILAMGHELLAAMDSEPVAWTWHYREQWYVTSDKRRAAFVAKDGDVAVLPLYRYAQPAPVVPEKCPAEIRDLIDSHSDALFNDDDAQEIWNACRAAMLAAAPQEVNHG